MSRRGSDIWRSFHGQCLYMYSWWRQVRAFTSSIKVASSSEQKRAWLAAGSFCGNSHCRYDNAGCGRSYLSQRDLEAHRLYRHTKDKGLGQTVVPTHLGAAPTQSSLTGFTLPPFFQLAVSWLVLLLHFYKTSHFSATLASRLPSKPASSTINVRYCKKWFQVHDGFYSFRGSVLHPLPPPSNPLATPGSRPLGPPLLPPPHPPPQFASPQAPTSV